MAQARKRVRLMDAPPALDVVERMIGSARADGKVSASLVEVREHVATVEITGPDADVERVYNMGAMARLW